MHVCIYHTSERISFIQNNTNLLNQRHTYRPKISNPTNIPSNITYTYARYPPTISPTIQHLNTEKDLKQAVHDNPETILYDTGDSNGGWRMKDMEGKILATVSDQMCEDLDV
jgi:hypothetical protein